MDSRTRTILQTLSIIWTVLLHCNMGDNSVSMTTQGGVNPTDQEQRPPVGHSDPHKASRGGDGHARTDIAVDTATKGSSSAPNGEKVPLISPAPITPYISNHAQCDPKKDALLISKCPDTAGEVDKTMCQSDEAPPTVDTIFPVTDSVSGYHFRNVHCWRCFNPSGEPLPWSAELGVTSENTPNNYSSLASFLLHADINPALTTWNPPAQLSYPRCPDTEFFSCILCQPQELEFNGCSLLGRPQFKGLAVYNGQKCYACTRHQAEHWLNETDLNLCEDLDPGKITHVSRWLFFLTSSTSNALMVEITPGFNLLQLAWTSRKCSVDSGMCSITACNEGVPVVDGVCDVSAKWFAISLYLCQTTEIGKECSQQKPGNFLDPQFRNIIPEPVNITALDLFYEDKLAPNDHRNDSCLSAVDDDLDPNYSDTATLKDTLIIPTKDLISFHEQTDNFAELAVDITERNDSDTLKIEVRGWVRTIGQNSVINARLTAVVVQTLATAGVEGNVSFCRTYLIAQRPISPVLCEVLTFCGRGNKNLAPDANRIAGRLLLLVVVLIPMMLHLTGI